MGPLAEVKVSFWGFFLEFIYLRMVFLHTCCTAGALLLKTDHLNNFLKGICQKFDRQISFTQPDYYLESLT